MRNTLWQFQSRERWLSDTPKVNLLLPTVGGIVLSIRLNIYKEYHHEESSAVVIYHHPSTVIGQTCSRKKTQRNEGISFWHWTVGTQKMGEMLLV